MFSSTNLTTSYDKRNGSNMKSVIDVVAQKSVSDVVALSS